MHRRDALSWLSRTLTAAVTAVIGVPAVEYVRSTFRRPAQEESPFRRVVRVTDLKPGQPLLATITGSRQDAWIKHANQPIGRIWLVRQAGKTGDTPEVSAFSSICPHMGCQVQFQGTGGEFLCPCHRGIFSLEGAPVLSGAGEQKTKVPRGLDRLECRIVPGNQPGEAWVEVKYETFELGLTRKVPRT